MILFSTNFMTIVMTNLEQIDMNSLSQYTVTISEGVIDDNSAKTENNFNTTSNIHEIDEEDEEETYVEDCSRNAPLDNSEQLEECTEDTDEDEHDDVCDNESTYSADSFCSDLSYQDTEEVDAANAKCASSRPTSPLNREDNVPHGDQEDGLESESDHIDYESYITGGLENSTSSEKFGTTRCKRKNMSFTDEEMRKIERENELLLRKIMAQHRPRNKANTQILQQPRVSSSAINRKKMQQKIEGDNMILLRRIQQAKSRVMTNTTPTGYRLTFFQCNNNIGRF